MKRYGPERRSGPFVFLILAGAVGVGVWKVVEWLW